MHFGYSCMTVTGICHQWLVQSWSLHAFLNSSTVQEKFKELQAFLSTSISLEVQGVSGPILER